MRKPRLPGLFTQVLLGVAAGILLGVLEPKFASAMKPIGDGFINLIKMVFAPIVFSTVVLGIARLENIRELGRVGLRAVVYFEVLSTVALLLGVVVVNVVKPGSGMNVDVATLDPKAIASYTGSGNAPQGVVEFLLRLIPASIVEAFARNEVLPILVFSVLLGVVLSRLGARAQPLVDVLDAFMQGMFGILEMIMHLAPLAAFGAMAFTVGKYGFASMLPLGMLMACMALTCTLFVVLILGPICRMAGFGLWKFLKYLREELVTVLGTSSSESVVPQLMLKLERVGVQKSVVGLVVPSGLTFNPDGQCIYYTMAAIFIAQATNTPLTLMDQFVVLGVLMLTSKGSAGVTGSAFVTLAATLASLGKIPVAGMVLLLGVDRFMSGMRSMTNTIGNAVGTMAIARWVGMLDTRVMRDELERGTPVRLPGEHRQ